MKFSEKEGELSDLKKCMISAITATAVNARWLGWNLIRITNAELLIKKFTSPFYQGWTIPYSAPLSFLPRVFKGDFVNAASLKDCALV